MIMPQKRSKISWPLALALGVGIVVLLGSMYYYLSHARVENERHVASQIQQLKVIFNRINESCKITGFRDEKNRIDFLNVGTFAGSVIGSMNLMEPKNWKGPYLDESLTAQGKEYQIIVLKSGRSYIIPGEGVKLGNGQVIGKTLHITADSSIEDMMRDPKALYSEGQVLAAEIDTYRTLADTSSKQDNVRSSDIS